MADLGHMDFVGLASSFSGFAASLLGFMLFSMLVWNKEVGRRCLYLMDGKFVFSLLSASPFLPQWLGVGAFGTFGFGFILVEASGLTQVLVWRTWLMLTML